jgi:hypothetical protein
MSPRTHIRADEPSLGWGETSYQLGAAIEVELSRMGWGSGSDAFTSRWPTASDAASMTHIDKGRLP